MASGLNPGFAPRLDALLGPGLILEDAGTAEPLAQAVLEDAIQGRATDVHIARRGAPPRVAGRTSPPGLTDPSAGP